MHCSSFIYCSQVTRKLPLLTMQTLNPKPNPNPNPHTEENMKNERTNPQFDSKQQVSKEDHNILIVPSFLLYPKPY